MEIRGLLKEFPQLTFAYVRGHNGNRQRARRLAGTKGRRDSKRKQWLFGKCSGVKALINK